MNNENDVSLSNTKEANNQVTLLDGTASPGPLGLFAFGMCTVLLSLSNAGVIGMDSMILSMGLFYGGVTQIMVGLMEAKKGNTFGLVAFTSYGIFWVSFVAINVMPTLGWMEPASDGGMIAFLILWGVFSVLLFIGTLKLNRVLQLLFGTLILLFLLLVVGSYANSDYIILLAGYEGVVCGLVSLYAASAFLLNEVYGKQLLPVGAL